MTHPITVVVEESTVGWWQVLLGGALGALVGAGATIGAVWLAIRHERKLRQSELLDQAVARMFGSAYDQVLVRKREGDKQPDVETQAFDLHELFSALAETAIRSKRAEPQLHTCASRLLRQVTLSAAVGDRSGAGAAYLLAATWIGEPERIRRGEITADTLLDTIRTSRGAADTIVDFSPTD